MLTLSKNAAKHPKTWFWVSGLISLFVIFIVALPSILPGSFFMLNSIKIDTDPENMLPQDEPVRVFHNSMKEEFGISDIVVVGVVNETHPNGVFNTESLANIYDLANYAQQISWQENESTHGVIGIDLIAPSTVDNIEQGGLGSVRFEYLMSAPPLNDEDAKAIAEKAMRIPFLKGTLISEDSKAIALYIPIHFKNDSYKVAENLRSKILSYSGSDKYHITGLPIAQDQFGLEMFKQMAISAPIAMILIFILMWWFFRHLKLVMAPLLVALISVVFTMGLLVITGNTVHIMSSMIPIFIMPIAVLDSVHILSDFFDRYPEFKDRRKTINAVMRELSAPMLFTSITTCTGFASLTLTPIPPVAIFGIFVAVGVFFAWFLTITLVPAYIMLLSESSLTNFGNKANGTAEKSSLLSKILQNIAKLTFKHGRMILFVTIALGGVAAYGIAQIQINDNPVKWFNEKHSIRVADKTLNERFGGTYMAYLTLQEKSEKSKKPSVSALFDAFEDLKPSVRERLRDKINGMDSLASEELINRVSRYISEQVDSAASDEQWEAWDAAQIKVSEIAQRSEIFKQPQTINLIAELQQHLLTTGLVGKSNGLPDIIKTVHRELLLGENDAFRIPDTQAAVAQTLIAYESSHRPHDLWHFVSPDYKKANLWIQLKSGDNRDMKAVIEAVDKFFDDKLLEDKPFAVQLEHQWFGLTYINVIWQEKMVEGMLNAFLGSFLIVLLIMSFLFRSLWWGMLCMLPLTITISAIYGIIGFIGKDYDMPVAVLSALSLGLAVDYAIHFLARGRYLQRKTGSWELGIKAVFGEPARAITRNVVVIGVGFLPLLIAPLVPYQTVGVFISSILLFAGLASLLILPAVLTQFEKLFFKSQEKLP